MNKTEKVIKEIIENEEELKEFLKQETMDELYSFILKKDGTITEEEFDETVANMLENYVSLTELKEVNEEDLESISGGIGKLGTKMASVALSALTLVPGFTSLAGATNGTNGAQENNNKSILRTAKEYISNKYVKAKNVIKKHPKIFAAGLAAAIVLSAGVATSVVAVRHHKNKQQNIKQGQNNQQSSSSATDKSEEKSEEKPEEKSEEKPEEKSEEKPEEKSEEKSEEKLEKESSGTPVARPLPKPPVSGAAAPGVPAAPVAPVAPVAPGVPPAPVAPPAPPAPAAPLAPPAPKVPGVPAAPGVPPAPAAPLAPPAPKVPGVPAGAPSSPATSVSGAAASVAPSGASAKESKLDKGEEVDKRIKSLTENIVGGHKLTSEQENQLREDLRTMNTGTFTSEIINKVQEKLKELSGKDFDNSSVSKIVSSVINGISHRIGPAIVTQEGSKNMSKEITKRIIEKIVADRNLISDRDWLKVAASLVPMSSDITTGASKKLADACRKQGIEISETDGSDLIEQSEFGKMLINGINKRDRSKALFRAVTSRRPFMEEDDDGEESDDW